MIKVSVCHEYKDGKRFDMDYYLSRHIPAVREKLGAACKRIEVDRGISGAQPGSKPPFFVMTHLLFDSVEDFRAAFAPHTAWLAEDRKRYTDEPPLFQISEAEV